MKSQNKSNYTIQGTNKALTTINKNTNINDPEQVKQYIANKPVTNGYKKLLCTAYDKYADYYQISWEMPRYQPEAKLRRIPTTQNLNLLIAKARRKLSTQLTLSKETGLRPVELMNLKMKDIDLEHRKVYPTTAKNGAPRTLKIGKNLQAMLTNHINVKALNLNDKLFTGTAETYSRNYRKMRNNLANKIGNPTLKTIRLYDLRHYFATMIYQKTRDIIYVKQQMGHIKIETTLRYVQLLEQTDDEQQYHVKTATTIKQATNLLENGFTYIQTIDDIKIYRKRK